MLVSLTQWRKAQKCFSKLSKPGSDILPALKLKQHSILISREPEECCFPALKPRYQSPIGPGCSCG